MTLLSLRGGKLLCIHVPLGTEYSQLRIMIHCIYIYIYVCLVFRQPSIVALETLGVIVVVVVVDLV